MDIRPRSQHFKATFYDGAQSRREEAELTLSSSRLQIELPDRCVAWDYEDAKMISDGFYGEPSRVEHPLFPAAALIVSDPEFGEALAQHTAKLGARAWWDQRLSGWAAILRSVVAAGILASSFYYIGIGFIAELGVRLAPRSMEERMGESTVKLIVAPAQTCPDSEATQLLARVEQRLFAAAKAEFQSEYRFKVTYARLDMVNAFAAPGGRVVVGASLVRLAASPEEYAGVLAHEISHVIHRDSLRALARNLGGSAILGLLSLDPSSNAILMSQSLEILNLSYSRSAEDKADEEGLRLMRRAKLNQDGLALFLARLLETERGGVRLPAYFSTHPDSSQRISILNAKKQSGAAVDAVMSQEEWKLAQNVCLATSFPVP